ncbi:virulence factor SrfC family protein, partial [Pseudooceanicola sp.]
ARPRPAPATADGGIRTLTLEQFQAETAMEAWIDRLKAFRDDRIRRAAFGLRDNTSADLVTELIHAARRLRLGQKTAEQLEEVNFGLNVEKQAQPAAILGAECINGFVATLGMLELPESQRPQVQTPEGATRPIFTADPASDTVDTLPAQPRNVAEETWSDWVFALDAVFAANAKDGIGGEVNIEQNLALGRILAALQGRETA